LSRRAFAPHVLLGLTLLLIAIQPLETAAGELFVRVVLGLVIAGSVLAVHRRRALLLVGVILGFPAIVLIILDPGGDPSIVGLVLGIATLSFVCVVLLLRIFDGAAFTAESISSSLSVYLLLGIVWSLAYSLTELRSAGSFYGLSDGGPAEAQRDLFYYSFVTLTTLGYGDIGPVAPAARALAITEAVIGQLYLVVLVASLVGGFLNMKASEREES